MNARICPLCKGRGTIYFSTQSPSVVTPSPSTSNQKANERICNVCKGKGYVEAKEQETKDLYDFIISDLKEMQRFK